MIDPQAAIRPAAVAGMFYPAEPAELEAVVRADLARAAAAAVADGPPAATSEPPHALVAPHAGYAYSGPVAASAYVRVRDRRDTIERVVLLGPAHRVPLRAMALPTVDGFATPLGIVPIDGTGRSVLTGHPDVVLDDRPHAQEHSLEVHLPFLQVVLGDAWSLLPIVVGQVPATSVAELLRAVWGGPETLVVVSTDLSHYHDHDTARSLDATTAAAIVARRGDLVLPHDACGVYPLRGLLAEAERLDLPVESVDLRTSGDTAGDRRRVVGYGAFTVG